MANRAAEIEETHPCENCGRNFVKSSLLKHEPICRKMEKSRRVIFDSGIQRATGSDITIDNVNNARKEREKLGGTFPRPKTSWREKHETFVNALSASKHVNYALRTGTPLPPPPKAPTPSDYLKCEYCERNFNEAAARRHIPFCKMQYEKKGPLRVTSNTKPLKINNPPRKVENQNSAKSILASHRKSSSLTRNGKPSSQKQHRSNSSSRRIESSQQATSNDANKDEKRSRSAPRSSSKSRAQVNTSSGREHLNSSVSYRVSNGEKILRLALSQPSNNNHKRASTSKKKT